MTKINITVKQAGRKRPIFNAIKIELKENAVFLSDFLKEIVKNQVEEFNNKRLDENFLSFLTSKEIEEKSKLGKVSFGDVNDKTLADFDKAFQAALLAYTDGLFKVFIDDKICNGLNDKIELHEDSEVIFIKLTFLAGRSY